MKTDSETFFKNPFAHFDSPTVMRIWSHIRKDVLVIQVPEYFQTLLEGQKTMTKEAIVQFVDERSVPHEAEDIWEILRSSCVLIDQNSYQTFYLSDVNEDYLHAVSQICLYQSPGLLVEEAKKQGYQVDFFLPQAARITRGSRTHLIQRQMFSTLIKGAAADRTFDKYLCAQFLQQHDLPAPRSVKFMPKDFHPDLIKDLSFPVVIKPVNGNGSNSVVCDIETPAELESIISEQAYLEPIELLDGREPEETELLVEEFVSGNTYRFLFACSEIICVTQIDYPTVTGDGVHTIEELMILQKIRRPNDERPFHPSVLIHLQKEGLSLQNVLSEGETLLVTKTAAPGLNAMLSEADQKIPDEIKRLVIKTMQTLDFRFGCIEGVVPERDGNEYFDEIKFIDVNPATDYFLHGQCREGFITEKFIPKMLRWLMESSDAKPVEPLEVDLFTIKE